MHKDDSNFVFTTEGHILVLDARHLRPITSVRRKLRRVENLQCPAYQPPKFGNNYNDNNGLLGGVQSREDFDFARALVGAESTSSDEQWWSSDNQCILPPIIPYVG